MKITFDCDQKFVEDTKRSYRMEISKSNNKVMLEIIQKDYNNGTGTRTPIVFKKETLKDFIGALLHIQSKLNKSNDELKLS